MSLVWVKHYFIIEHRRGHKNGIQAMVFPYENGGYVVCSKFRDFQIKIIAWFLSRAIFSKI